MKLRQFMHMQNAVQVLLMYLQKKPKICRCRSISSILSNVHRKRKYPTYTLLLVLRRRYCFVKTALWLNRMNMAANGEKHLSVRFLRQRIFRTPTTRKMNFKAHKNLVRHLCAVLKANWCYRITFWLFVCNLTLLRLVRNIWLCVCCMPMTIRKEVRICAHSA